MSSQYGVGVEQLQRLAGDAAAGEGGQRARRRRLELLGHVDVAERVLWADVVDREPLQPREPLALRQHQAHLLVVVTLQDVRSTMEMEFKCHDVLKGWLETLY